MNKIIEIFGNLVTVAITMIALHMLGVEHTAQLCAGAMMVIGLNTLFSLKDGRLASLVSLCVIYAGLGTAGFADNSAGEIYSRLALLAALLGFSLCGFSALVIRAGGYEQPPVRRTSREKTMRDVPIKDITTG